MFVRDCSFQGQYVGALGRRGDHSTGGTRDSLLSYTWGSGQGLESVENVGSQQLYYL